MLDRAAKDRAKAAKAVAAAILSVLVIFLVILLIGSPIVTLGESPAESAVYMILVFMPVAAVCALAVIKSSKTS